MHFKIGQYTVYKKVCENKHYLQASEPVSNDEIFKQFGISRDIMVSFPGCIDKEKGVFPYYNSEENLETVINYLSCYSDTKDLHHLIKEILCYK